MESQCSDCIDGGGKRTRGGSLTEAVEGLFEGCICDGVVVFRYVLLVSEVMWGVEPGWVEGCFDNVDPVWSKCGDGHCCCESVVCCPNVPEICGLLGKGGHRFWGWFVGCWVLFVFIGAMVSLWRGGCGVGVPDVVE